MIHFIWSTHIKLKGVVTDGIYIFQLCQSEAFACLTPDTETQDMTNVILYGI